MLYKYNFYVNNTETVLRIESSVSLSKLLLDTIKNEIDGCYGYGFDTNGINIGAIKNLDILVKNT